ncbi:hypothetical protein SCALIN_C01_0144 [Candidatus Scalindua japonica]|uniref:Response regulatory domain-containing protein n=1 Tax=Candidatus Scalindua japonica TaxID=1284222 RepID=A0A286TTM4_9BACT|nr:response regulator [Candidatus Scalindua japonica]GAX59213.1 hypothetical protein SCALIN_C01_0144 [Candidatus Scalindua japonica]
MKINKTILVIDDDSHIRRVIELKLRKAGYEVIIAENGESGIQICNTRLPDAVITDVVMPKMDGKAVLRRTKELKKEYSFLTIIISCSIGFEEHHWIKDIPDTHFMEKPFSLNKVLDCVDQYFGIKR